EPGLSSQKDRQKDRNSKKAARPAASVQPVERTAQQEAAQDDQSAQDASQDMSQDISMAQLLNGEDEHTERAFAKAMQGVKPLTVQGGREVVPAKEGGSSALAGARLDEQLYGRIEFAVDKKDEYVEGYVVGLDPRILDRLKAGAICPESSTDLHGLRVENSFEELRAFIRRCWEKGMRCLVIVHGRGKNSPGGVGVLCDRLRLWLTQEPFKRVVLAFCTAKPRHGGPGSLYVLLRKYKKKAPVSWDATPYDLYQQD
ncbi:MAG: Smr/MutS family protein, partial [Desulfovibrionaceae bacterium]|nr:Smr/MutS family protein [Desulfovibrionaceae bacterium]